MSSPNQIQRLQDTWNRLGHEDPMWAVASNRERWNEDEFFSTGTAEIEAVMAYVEDLGLGLQRRRALDFGCGLGRLTRAFSRHFEETVGVDIAPSMVAAAADLNQDRENVSFVVNDRLDLDTFDSGAFDLVYSNITLQHMKPDLAAGYIRAFLRVVSDRGLVLFQMPAAQLPGTGGTRARLARARDRGLRHSLRALTRRVAQPRMEMNCIPRDEVIALIERSDGTTIDVQPNRNAGPLYESYTYAAVRGRSVSS
jgi:SAM-dependent methyltransferase